MKQRVKALSLSLSLSCVRSQLVSKLHKKNFTTLSIISLFTIITILINTGFSVINGFKEYDNSIFIYFGSLMHNGLTFYKQLFDVKGPLFFEVIYIATFLQWTGVLLFFIIVVFWIFGICQLHKMFFFLTNNYIFSLISSIFVLILVNKILYAYHSAEEMFVIPLLFQFFRIFFILFQSSPQKRIFVSLGINMSFIFWIKHFNLLLPLIMFVVTFIVLISKDKERVIYILKNSYISFITFIGSSILILLPFFTQGTIKNMIALYFEMPSRLSHFSLDILPVLIKSISPRECDALIITLLSFLFVIFSSYKHRTKFIFCCSIVLTFYITYSFALETILNASSQYILSCFSIFIPLGFKDILSMCESLKFSKALSAQSLLLGIILLLVYSVDVNYSSIMDQLTYKITDYSKKEIYKFRNNFKVFKTTKLPSKDICSKYYNKVFVVRQGYNNFDDFSLSLIPRTKYRITDNISDTCKIISPIANYYRYYQIPYTKWTDKNTKDWTRSVNSNLNQIISNYDNILYIEGIKNPKDTESVNKKIKSKFIDRLPQKFSLNEVYIYDQIGFFVYSKQSRDTIEPTFK